MLMQNMFGSPQATIQVPTRQVPPPPTTKKKSILGF
jgi:hypothetical protein